jgi:hypothetical protein
MIYPHHDVVSENYSGLSAKGIDSCTKGRGPSAPAGKQKRQGPMAPAGEQKGQGPMALAETIERAGADGPC